MDDVIQLQSYHHFVLLRVQLSLAQSIKGTRKASKHEHDHCIISSAYLSLQCLAGKKYYLGLGSQIHILTSVRLTSRQTIWLNPYCGPTLR